MKSNSVDAKKIISIVLKVLLTLGMAALVVWLCLSQKTTVEDAESQYYLTVVSLVPPLVAIVLALVTKEVYSSLFLGILVGALLNSNFNFVKTMEKLFADGMVGTALNDAWNLGILVFLVVLGVMVVLVNKAGGSAAFGRWATKHIKSKVGASICTIILGILIFIDDYFNCLTVGSVMKPVMDSKKISKEKFAYLIDATAAPICIIAPISSWAAAVSGFTPEGTNGLYLFIKTIPYNIYAILTIVMMLVITFAKFDYGPMRRAELAAASSIQDKMTVLASHAEENHKGKVRGTLFHLLIPIIVLIGCCVVGMVYTGGFFDGENFIDAFANSDASIGLVYGSAVALVFTMFFFVVTRAVSFKECMASIPEGFKNMVPAILILVFAWTLKAMTDSLGAADYVAGLVEKVSGYTNLMALLPAFIFLVSLALAFATGTSWGTFGILIPIVISAFSAGSTTADLGNELMIISISASMAGAVCGDHCSPISDTTIMASAGAGCEHVKHVSTQLPYALTVAAISFVGYIIAGYVKMWYVALPVSAVLLIGVLIAIKFIGKKKNKNVAIEVVAEEQVEAAKVEDKTDKGVLASYIAGTVLDKESK